jgi:hypothetical protein
VAQDGALLDTEHGANLTTRKFDDFKLHIEFNCPDGGNSGIYLRGRDEIQVAYKSREWRTSYTTWGPSTDLSRPPRKCRENQANGKASTSRWWAAMSPLCATCEDGRQSEDSRHQRRRSRCPRGRAWAFYLQGDHTGGMKYRNITISTPKK